MRKLALSCLVLLALVARPVPSLAHPGGAASVDRSIVFAYAGDGRFRVAYALDFAEGPAYAEILALDENHDGSVTAEEQRHYLDARIPPLVAAWVVEVDGARVRPSVVASHIDVVPGQGGQDTVRIDCEVSVVSLAPSPGETIALHVHDDAFSDSPGLHTISLEGPAGAPPRVERGSDARFVIHAAMGPHANRTVVLVAATCLLIGALAVARMRGPTGAP